MALVRWSPFNETADIGDAQPIQISRGPGLQNTEAAPDGGGQETPD